MKFNCGPSFAERVNLRHERLQNWHRKFAFWPVRVAPGDCRWMEYVWRKGTYHMCYDPFWTWQYRSWERGPYGNHI